MNLRFLRAFVAAAEDANFAEAAAGLEVTQSTLSRRIAAVEAEVGALLFDRTGRRATLTPAGAAYLAEARALVAHAEEAADLARRVAAGRAGHLTVGFVGPAAFGLLPAALRRHREAAPGVAVRLREMRTSEQREALIGGRLDLAIAHGGLGEGTDDIPFASRRLREEARLVALPEHHPFARMEGPVELAHLADTPFVFFEPDFEPAHHAAFVALCRAAGFEPRFAQRANRLYVVLALVAAGLGAAPVTQPVADALRPEGVVTRPLAGVPPLPLVAVWRRRGRTPTVSGFLDALARAGEGLSAVIEPCHPTPGSGGSEQNVPHDQVQPCRRFMRLIAPGAAARVPAQRMCGPAA